MTSPENESENPAARERPLRSKRIVQGLLSVLCLGYIAYFFVANRHTLDVAFHIDPQQLLLLVFLLVVYFVLYSYRFVLLIEKHCSCRIPIWTWFRMLIVMRVMNNIIPQMGTVYRGVRLKKEYGISYTDYITANVFFVWMDTVFNFVLAALLLWSSGVDFPLGNFSGMRVLLIGAAGLLLLPFLSRFLVPQSGAKGKLAFLARKLRAVADGNIIGLRDPVYLLKVNGVALLSFLNMAWIFQLLFRSTNAEVSWQALSVFYALYRLTFHVNLTPGNIGIRELAYGFLSEQANVGMAEGILVSAELRVLSVFVLLLLGLFFAWRELREEIRRVFAR